MERIPYILNLRLHTSITAIGYVAYSMLKQSQAAIRKTANYVPPEIAEATSVILGTSLELNIYSASARMAAP